MLEFGLGGWGWAVRGRFCPEAKTELNTSAAKINEVRRVTATSLNRASLVIPNLSIVSLVINLSQPVKSPPSETPREPVCRGTERFRGVNVSLKPASVAGANSVAIEGGVQAHNKQMPQN